MLAQRGIGAVPEYNFALGSGDSASFITTGAGRPQIGTPQVGYAVVTAGGQGAGASGSGVGGTAVFIQIDLVSGTVINEAGVPLVKALSEFSLFVDTMGTRDTALAIVNTGSPVPAGGSTTPTVLLSLFDTIASGAALATSTEPMPLAQVEVPIPTRQQVNRFIATRGPGGYFDTEQVSELEDFQGSVAVTNANPGDGSMWAALTVRTNNAGKKLSDGLVSTFTPFPVVPGAVALVAVGMRGTVTQESTGTLHVTLDLRDATHPVKGAIFYLSDRGALIGEEVRSVETLDFASFILEVPARSGPVNVDGVEVRLIYEGGEITPRMPIQ